MSQGAMEENKVAAIMGAVGAYLASEQEAEAAVPRPVRAAAVGAAPWASAGRRLQMDQRWLMQMRTFR